MTEESGSYEVGDKKPPLDTRFGAERANPQSQNAGSNKPWSIRNCIRDFSNREFGYADIRALTEDELIEKILSPFKRVTMIQVGTARQVARYMKTCAEAQYMTDQIDGKVAQEFIIPSLAPAPDDNETIEGAEKAYRENINK